MKPLIPDSPSPRAPSRPEPVISVIIPVYNRIRMLERALRSVSAQQRPADEVIVVDDGSNDGVAALVRGFPDVQYLKQARQGVSAARNTGIRAARGNWIALLDSDDEWHPDKLLRQCLLIADQPDCVLVHCDEIWIRNGRRINPGRKHRKRGGHIFRHCLPLCAISPSAVLIRKSVLDGSGLFDESLPACEDYDLWLRLCSRHAVEYIDRPLLTKYGGHPDQLSKQHWGMDRFRIEALNNILQQQHLRPRDRQAATDMLVKKCRIFINGAVRRGRTEHIEKYRNILAQYTVTTP